MAEQMSAKSFVLDCLEKGRSMGYGKATLRHYFEEILAENAPPSAYKHIIDCDAAPYLHPYWEVKEHQKGGLLEWNLENIALYKSDQQKPFIATGRSIHGEDLYKELTLMNKKLLNANTMKYLRDHKELIPEDWQGKRIFFWGTIMYDQDGDECVYCLEYKEHSGRRGVEWANWGEEYQWLSRGFYDNDYALILKAT